MLWPSRVSFSTTHYVVYINSETLILNRRSGIVFLKSERQRQRGPGFATF